jgi:hypothetical protein
MFERYGDIFGLLGRTFIASYVNTMGLAQALPATSPVQTRGGMPALGAIGKTDLEISMIIGRSRATVRFHIHNASIKLDAVNRSQTVFRPRNWAIFRCTSNGRPYGQVAPTPRRSWGQTRLCPHPSDQSGL